MAISKIVDRQGNAIIDLSNDTVTPETVAEGKTFHDANGNVQIGTGNAIEDADGDWDIHNNFYFIDYDGELLYKYSMQELQNLTELPTPTVQHENLTFDEWNWTLEDLKNESAGIIVGANYHTTDGRDHMKVKAVEDGKSIVIILHTLTGTESVTLDWGDGTTGTWSINTSANIISHTYTNVGTYDISIVNQNDNMSFLSSVNSSYSYSNEYVYPIEINLHTNAILGDIHQIGSIYAYGEGIKMSIPSSINISSVKDYTFKNFFNIIALVLPRTVTSINYNDFMYGCYLLKLLSIPKLTETSISKDFSAYCYSLKYLTIPDGVETLSNSDLFYQCSSLRCIRFPSTLKTCSVSTSSLYLKKIIIPEGTTSCNLYTEKAEYVVIPSTCSSFRNTNFYNAKYLDIGNASSSIYVYCDPEVIINRTSRSVNNSSYIGLCCPKYYRADYIINDRVIPSTLDLSNWKGSSAPVIDSSYYYNLISSVSEILVPADKYEEWRVLNIYWKKLDKLGKLKAA